MPISVVIPIWNGRDMLERLFDTLDQQTQPASEILVVDNGSEDGAPDLARRRGARVIAMGRNTGFAPAVNRGIRECTGDWIAVLNSDVELSPEYFERLIRSDAAFATGKILSLGDPHTIDATFDAVCRGGTAWRAGSGRKDSDAFAREREIHSPPWTAVLFRADLFCRVGLLEESFESYVEDVDFGLRCAAAGIRGSYVPSAIAFHRGSATLGRWHPDTVRRIARNQVLLLARHYPAGILWRCCWPILVAQSLWGLLAFRHAAGGAWLAGKWQGLRAFSQARRKSGPYDPEVLERLRDDERLIHSIQRQTGFDSYWRLYFLLTFSGTK